MEDQGTYSCVVSNIAGRDETQVRIEVKGEGQLVLFYNSLYMMQYSTVFFTKTFPSFSEPTLIVKRPESMKVIRGTDVRFECGVKADATTPVTTTWMKNKKELSIGWR